MNKDETQKGPNIHGSSEPVFHLMTYLHIIYLLPLEKLELLSGYFSVMTCLHCPPPPHGTVVMSLAPSRVKVDISSDDIFALLRKKLGLRRPDIRS
jgi:hypothetical protein